MKKLFFLIVLILASWKLQAVSLTESKYFDYQVFFTNPECPLYHFLAPIETNDGSLIYHRPQGAYCTQNDLSFNESRVSSPHFHLIRLLENKDINNYFISFLSFSNTDFINKICQVVQEKEVVFNILIDSNNQSKPAMIKTVEFLNSCHRKSLYKNGELNIFFKGNRGGIGFAHNKLIIAKYKNSEKVKIVFSSGNMSAGTSLHHENWHFITTHQKTFFSQIHNCLQEGTLNFSESKKEFEDFMSQCRKKIIFPEEEDIQLFYIPSMGQKALSKINEEIEKSYKIQMAFHRLSHGGLIEKLGNFISDSNKILQLVGDDDIYWSGKLKRAVGSNTKNESFHLFQLKQKGAHIRYVETNEFERLLHHNKYLIFHYDSSFDEGAVFAGAGNFTYSAFEKNFENFYLIKIPKIYQVFKQQYDYVWHNLATPFERLPKDYQHPLQN
jgi:hypothetical protein